MAANSKIEWTDHTFNPWIGCTKVSVGRKGGCERCYAEALMATRYGKVEWGPGKPRVRTSAANWRQPHTWNRKAAKEGRRYRVFCASLADVFDNEVDPAWRADLFELIRATPNLDWMLLTKRIGNAVSMIDDALESIVFRGLGTPWRWPWPHVWIGATIVNREELLRDGPKLKATPAAMHFWSVEPILDNLGDIPPDVLPDWIIVGGESGVGARPTAVEHIRGVVRQCRAANVPVFVKQMGARLEWNDPEPELSEPPYWMPIKLLHPKGADMAEWCEDLRLRELPRIRQSKPKAVDVPDA